MPTIWFNHAYASTRDALTMIRDGARVARRQVRLLASHRDPDAAVLNAADESLVEPVFADGEDAAYLDWCLDICRARRVALFVPGFGKARLAPYAAAFAAVGTTLSVPADADTLALLHDKTRFTAAAVAAGLPMPWTREVRDVAVFDAALDELAARGLPACVKPPQGVFGAGFWRLDPDCSAFGALMDPDARVLPPDMMRVALAEPGAALLVMEHLPGDEWSIDALCDQGRLIVGVARRKAERVQVIEVGGPVLDIARTAAKLFRLSGLVNLQCRAAGEGGADPRLLEINARMSGGCLYTAFGGVNLPWWHVALALGLGREADIPTPAGGARVAAVAGAVQIEAQASLARAA